MNTTYQLLAKNAILALEQSNQDRLWIAVCGGPGAGKTTLATAVSNAINKLPEHKIQAICLSMDGYHYTRTKLCQLHLDIKRRGAPWTFDAERMARDLQEATQNPRRTKLFPAYSRENSDPLDGQVKLESKHQIIIVEGNYLMMGKLWSECRNLGGDNCDVHLPYDYDGPCSIQDEIKRWKTITDLFDYTWFVNPCAGFEEQRRRLIQRALKTWTDAKTLDWGGGTSLEAATRRVDYNDFKNAVLVDACRKYADIVVASV